MSQKYIYLIEHYIIERPTNVGIFTSRKKAESFLKKLPKKHEYTIYKLPINSKLTKGEKLEDQQGIFDHWHYGTIDCYYEEYSDDGKLIEKGNRIEVFWPD
jgi:hypothetical protein